MLLTLHFLSRNSLFDAIKLRQNIYLFYNDLLTFFFIIEIKIKPRKQWLLDSNNKVKLLKDS